MCRLWCGAPHQPSFFSLESSPLFGEIRYLFLQQSDRFRLQLDDRVLRLQDLGIALAEVEVMDGGIGEHVSSSGDESVSVYLRVCVQHFRKEFERGLEPS